MHQGFQVSNILEQSVFSNSALYAPHFSLFDIAISECDLDLYTTEPNLKEVFSKSKSITRIPSSDISWKSYGSYISSSPMQNLRQNIGTTLHVNSLWIVHDLSFLQLKKEDAYLICSSAFRPADQMIYFLNDMQQYSCPKIQKKQMTYSVPDEIKNDGTEKTKNIGVFCYNKSINEKIENIIECEADILSHIPSSLNDIAKELSEYKILVEFDPFSIYNILCGILCGSIGVILDPNGFLSRTYGNIPNLYIAESVEELKKILNSNLTFIESDTLQCRFRNFDKFKTDLRQTLNNMQRKAFLL